MFGPAAGPGYPQPGGEGLLVPAVQHGQDLWDSRRFAVSNSVCVQIPEAWTGATPEQEVRTRRSVGRGAVEGASGFGVVVDADGALRGCSGGEERERLDGSGVRAGEPEGPKGVAGNGGERKGHQPELRWATFWAWPETEEFAARNQMLVAKLDQGPLGYERRKPTTLLTNQVEVMALHGVAGPAEVGRWRIASRSRRCGRHGHQS